MEMPERIVSLPDGPGSSIQATVCVDGIDILKRVGMRLECG